MTRKQPRQKRQVDVIEAAVDEFVEKGYEGASMESIAARAGLTKGGLYHHFSGKDELLLAANRRFMEPIFRLMAEAVESPSPLAGLRAFVEGYLRHWVGRPRDMAFIMLSLYKTLSNPALLPAMKDYVTQMLDFYERLFASAVARKELRPHDCRARAMVLMSTVDGVTTYVLCGIPLDVALRAVTDVLLDELSAPVVPATRNS